MITINAQELKELLAAWPGMALLNVRPADTDLQDELPGSQHIPLAEFELRAQELPPDKDAVIAVYDLNLTCEASTKAGDILEKFGYRHIYNFTDGVKGWKDAGFPVA